MAELTESDPCTGLGLPLSLGACRLEALAGGAIVAIQPYPGRRAEVDAALAPLGLRFPLPGEVIAAGAARLVWAGRETAFLMGAPAPAGLEADAALGDQGDGWAGLHLEGADSVAVLARLVPLDLRAQAFAPGTVARSLLNHMPMLLIRVTHEAFEIRVFRSMAAHAVHEIAEAMRAVAARRARG